MGEIYRKVEGVVAFLGHDDEESLDFALDFIQAFARFESEDSQKFYRDIVVPRSSTWMRSCEGMRMIFRHIWWDRLWVYQEILLARKAELVLGRGKVLGWDVLEKAVATMYRQTSDSMLQATKVFNGGTKRHEGLWKVLLHDCGFMIAHGRVTDREFCLRYRESQERLDALREMFRMGHLDERLQEELFRAETWTDGFEDSHPATLLEQWLQFTRALKYSDPRNRVFAILGLVSNPSPFGVPDYSKEPREVYHDFAKALVPTALEFVRDAGFGVVDNVLESSYPSWAPDYSNTFEKPFSRFAGVSRADRNERVLADVTGDGKALKTASFYLDVVDEVFLMPFTTPESYDGLKDVLKTFPIVDWESRKEMLIRTLTTDIDEYGRRLSDETVKI